jgi:hypothetical protein
MSDKGDPAAWRKSAQLGLIDMAVAAVLAGLVGFFLFVVLSSINW